MGAIVAASACGTDRNDRREEQAWAVLQGIEFRDRENPRVGPALESGPNGRMYLGIPGIGAPEAGRTHPPASSRSWIVLNEHASTREVRQINPYHNYDIRCAYVTNLRREVPDVDDYVLEHLNRICTR